MAGFIFKTQHPTAWAFKETPPWLPHNPLQPNATRNGVGECQGAGKLATKNKLWVAQNVQQDGSVNAKLLL